MRIYIIGNDGITLCREASPPVTDGEIAVASKEELHAAALSGKRLLVLCNALPSRHRGLARGCTGHREARPRRRLPGDDARALVTRLGGDPVADCLIPRETGGETQAGTFERRVAVNTNRIHLGHRPLWVWKAVIPWISGRQQMSYGRSSQ